MTRKAHISINLTAAEKAAVIAKAQELHLTASAYGYIKLFAPASQTIRTTDQKYAFGDVGLALNAARRMEVAVQKLATSIGTTTPEMQDLLIELQVVQRHTLAAHQHLLGDLRAG